MARTTLKLAAALALLAAPALADPMPTISGKSAIPAPPVARFYEDCFAQAAAAHTTRRDGEYLLFDCTGAPAQAFYDFLGTTEAGRATERAEAGRTWRYTAKPKKNLIGIDACWSDGEGGFGCTLIYHAGELLDAKPAA